MHYNSSCTGLQREIINQLATRKIELGSPHRSKGWLHSTYNLAPSNFWCFYYDSLASWNWKSASCSSKILGSLCFSTKFFACSLALADTIPRNNHWKSLVRPAPRGLHFQCILCVKNNYLTPFSHIEEAGSGLEISCGLGFLYNHWMGR